MEDFPPEGDLPGKSFPFPVRKNAKSPFAAVTGREQTKGKRRRHIKIRKRRMHGQSRSSQDDPVGGTRQKRFPESGKNFRGLQKRRQLQRHHRHGHGGGVFSSGFIFRFHPLHEGRRLCFPPPFVFLFRSGAKAGAENHDSGKQQDSRRRKRQKTPSPKNGESVVHLTHR